ncbi:MAG: hypothetical protein HFF09_07445 [Oscillospiraceae bacterium]|nr:hypothetical protein [Oscillospiraceae bacterium]
MVITGNAEDGVASNVVLMPDEQGTTFAVMELSGALGEHAQIGLSKFEYSSDSSDSPASTDPVLAVQGANGYTVSADDFKKLSSDSSDYRLKQESDGKVYFSNEPAEILTISTVEELKAFRDSVNAGNNYKDKTVTLTKDLNLNGSDNDQ